MHHLPLFAEIKDRACLIVGGGSVAERRAELLLSAGAKITILARELTAPLAKLADNNEIEFDEGTFETEALDRYWLIVAATDDETLNARVATAAEHAKRFCNVVDDPTKCTFVMPAIIDRDPMTIAISSGGHSPVLARRVKGLIETVLPARIGELAKLAGQWREQVKQALPDADGRRRFWQTVLGGKVAESIFAGRRDIGEAWLEKALAAWREEHEHGASVGEAYLVGAGPGSPDLITLRGRQLLAEADVVLYDRLVSPKLLECARRDAELISVGKTPGKPSITQTQLNRLLVRLVESGKRVCRLKGGDPMVFGRGGEEMEALAQAGLPFQIVPGVSAVEGCAAYAGIPLTLRGVSSAVLIATGQTKDDDSSTLANFKRGQTLALYMAVAQLESVSAQLIDDGHSPETPVAIVENGTTEDQRVLRTSLGSLAQARTELRIVSPALLLVGETVRFAERYNWFNPRGLTMFKTDSKGALARVS